VKTAGGCKPDSRHTSSKGTVSPQSPLSPCGHGYVASLLELLTYAAEPPAQLCRTEGPSPVARPQVRQLQQQYEDLADAAGLPRYGSALGNGRGGVPSTLTTATGGPSGAIAGTIPPPAPPPPAASAAGPATADAPPVAAQSGDPAATFGNTYHEALPADMV
jgi:hypothetical protein